MAKDPAFPFYAQDYLVDTLRWSRAMQGLHVSLMAESWANGGLHDDGGMPSGLSSTDVELWLKIKHKWNLVNGVWISVKLEEVRATRNEFREKQRKKGILSGEKRKNKQTPVQPETNNGSTKVEPIESESEKENDIELKLKGAFDEIYLEQQKMKWPHIDFDFQFRAFCEKVRGSPTHYQDHDTGGIRLAFQAQLRTAKSNNNGTGGQKQDKRTAETISRREAFARRYGASDSNG